MTSSVGIAVLDGVGVAPVGLTLPVGMGVVGGVVAELRDNERATRAGGHTPMWASTDPQITEKAMTRVKTWCANVVTENDLQ